MHVFMCSSHPTTPTLDLNSIGFAKPATAIYFLYENKDANCFLVFHFKPGFQTVFNQDSYLLANHSIFSSMAGLFLALCQSLITGPSFSQTPER